MRRNHNDSTCISISTITWSKCSTNRITTIWRSRHRSRLGWNDYNSAAGNTSAITGGVSAMGRTSCCHRCRCLRWNKHNGTCGVMRAVGIRIYTRGRTKAVGAIGGSSGDDRRLLAVFCFERNLVDVVEVGDLLARRRNVGNRQRQRPVPVKSDDFDGVRQPFGQVCCR